MISQIHSVLFICLSIPFQNIVISDLRTFLHSGPYVWGNSVHCYWIDRFGPRRYDMSSLIKIYLNGIDDWWERVYGNIWLLFMSGPGGDFALGVYYSLMLRLSKWWRVKEKIFLYFFVGEIKIGNKLGNVSLKWICVFF